MAKIKITEASAAQLREFANNNGIEVARGTAGQHIISKLLLVYPDLKEIDVAVEPSQAPLSDTSADKHITDDAALASRNLARSSDLHSDPIVKLAINSTEGPGGSNDVSLAVNGVAVLIKRDEEVSLPFRFYEALKNGVQHVAEPIPASLENKDGPVRYRKAFSYPFNVLEMPPKAEIDAYYERHAGGGGNVRQAVAA